MRFGMSGCFLPPDMNDLSVAMCRRARDLGFSGIFTRFRANDPHTTPKAQATRVAQMAQDGIGRCIRPAHTLYDGDRFVGYVAAEVEREARAGLVTVTGRSGGVCLMHTRLLHGSAANHSDRSRGLYICVYNAADAVPLAVSPLPNPNQGLLVRGPPTRRVRSLALDLELPPAARPVSFFATQGQHSAGD